MARFIAVYGNRYLYTVSNFLTDALHLTPEGICIILKHTNPIQHVKQTCNNGRFHPPRVLLSLSLNNDGSFVGIR
uniref:Uncharacterized protein n=1 Tax=Panagrellus redivivus TaxID=6233 RepID=A0A7E4UR38_PANRE